MSPHNDDPMIGRLIGDQYEVQRLIGKGGMAYVYMGQDTQEDREVAIKIITLQRDRANELMKRFQREERVIRQIDTHPNIIKVYGSGAEDQDTHYLLMELIRGETLTQRLKRYRRNNEYMPYSEVINIMSQTADAIDHVHRHNAIHRDIKPSNIMIEKDTERAVLMDFGLVMDFANNTTLGTAFGTPRYISPEQAISSQQAVPQSDVYSLGVVLYEALVGSTPFDEDSAMSMALSHITNPPPPLQTFREDLPDEIANVVLKALEKQPQDRYSTAREMIDALRVAVASAVDTSQEPALLPVEDTSLRAIDNTIEHDYDDQDEIALPSQPAIPSPLPQQSAVTDNEDRRRRNPVLLLVPVVIVLLALGAGFVLLAGGASSGDGASSGPPTAVPIGFETTDDIHLFYSSEALFIYNNTMEAIDLVNYRFALPDNSFSLDPTFFGNETRVIEPDTCIRVSLQNRQVTSSPAACSSQNLVDVYHQRKVQQSYYWVWDDTTNTTSDTFLVTTDDGREIRECLVADGSCSFEADAN